MNFLGGFRRNNLRRSSRNSPLPDIWQVSRRYPDRRGSSLWMLAVLAEMARLLTLRARLRCMPPRSPGPTMRKPNDDRAPEIHSSVRWHCAEATRWSRSPISCRSGRPVVELAGLERPQGQLILARRQGLTVLAGRSKVLSRRTMRGCAPEGHSATNRTFGTRRPSRRWKPTTPASASLVSTKVALACSFEMTSTVKLEITPTLRSSAPQGE